ncbi:MAG: hypothetical protein HZA34_04700 [Candidatus Pacebacteria bacterium]|nr:hypothetical protein [Candidatus Paceibacterota bacterium]
MNKRKFGETLLLASRLTPDQKGEITLEVQNRSLLAGGAFQCLHDFLCITGEVNADQIKAIVENEAASAIDAALVAAMGALSITTHGDMGTRAGARPMGLGVQRPSNGRRQSYSP